MYLLLGFAYWWVEWHIYPLISFCTINNTSISVKRCNFTLVCFTVACHANRGVERNFAGTSSYSFRHIFLKFSNTSANNNVLLWTYKSWYSPKFFFFFKFFSNLHMTKNLFFQVMIFHWIFCNHPYIHKDKHLFAIK